MFENVICIYTHTYDIFKHAYVRHNEIGRFFSLSLSVKISTSLTLIIRSMSGVHLYLFMLSLIHSLTNSALD